jgi:hypothetical protein
VKLDDVSSSTDPSRGAWRQIGADDTAAPGLFST